MALTLAQSVIATDTSYYQRGVDNTYSRGWLIFRACDGTFRDPRFASNYAWAKANSVRTVLHPAKPKIAGFTVYGVYRPGVDVFSVITSMVGKPHRKLTVMIDVESWGGQIGGDHSTEITALANKLAGWLGSQKRVLVYGNQGDLNTLYPHRPDWLKIVVAGYSSACPSFPNMIGWQYSDGQTKWSHPAGLPISTPPFGNCDHNVFPGYTADSLAIALGVGDAPTTDPLEEIVAFYGSVEAFEARLRTIVAEEVAKGPLHQFNLDANGQPRALNTWLDRIPGYTPPTPKGRAAAARKGRK